eukprot:231031_1
MSALSYFKSYSKRFILRNSISKLLKPQYISTRYLSNKIFSDCKSAIIASGLKDGDTLCSGGFGLCGVPMGLIKTINNCQYKNLTLISNNGGTDDWGTGILINSGQIKRMISSYFGGNEEFARQYLNGEIEVELVPQGTLAERLRAGGSGIGGFYTRTGLGTWIETGEFPMKYKKNGNNEILIDILSIPKPKQIIDNIEYLFEKPLKSDVSIIKTNICDEFGNCQWDATARNINPECAMAGKYTIVECDKIVPIGSFKPENVHLSGVFIDAIVETNEKKIIEIMPDRKQKNISDKKLKIAHRAAKELHNGMIVNLGIGIPTLIPIIGNPNDMNGIWLHSENGIIGMGGYPNKGEESSDLVNAGKEATSLINGASIVSSSMSFNYIRGGHLDMVILGGMEVSQYGDIANWIVPGHIVKGMGGAMDLVAAPNTKVIVCMEHCNKYGKSKIVKECKLPVTGKKCVDKIITDLCVFDVDYNNGLTLIELMGDNTLDNVKKNTQCEFKISEKLKQLKV